MENGDQIHVFYRERHHLLFEYVGQAKVTKTTLLSDEPSQSEFEISCSALKNSRTVLSEE
jgi:hypothetical protein